ncbi:MAG: hypothetical protein [Microvirus sp.]|nr:MAG: hypothetical protein [Microvirus sp.]
MEDTRYHQFKRKPTFQDFPDDDKNPHLLKAAIQEKYELGEIEVAKYLERLYIKLTETPDKGVSEHTSRGFRGVVRRYR